MIKNDVKQYIAEKKTCFITDILAEFLISFEELYPILCILFEEMAIKQIGDQKIQSLCERCDKMQVSQDEEYERLRKTIFKE